MKINKYSFGIGDRFGMQGTAQLRAFAEALSAGVELTPVWNKSYREHQTVNTTHESVRMEADEAVRELHWQHPYLVDADHINLSNVDDFLPHADFFTIDVADVIGEKTSGDNIREFIKFNLPYIGKLRIRGMEEELDIQEDFVWYIGEKFLKAAGEASRIYQHIAAGKEKSRFIVEVSMDEVEESQSPEELFFILSALHFYEVNPRTIAPKFTGRFNKGVDYVGDLNAFRKEFEQDLLVIDHAVKEFGLDRNLKLSVHTGSDKFSLYPVIADLIRKHDKGIHVKTAGTTWLEELAGLALSGGKGLELAKNIYSRAWKRFDELTGPYANVIDIDRSRLPAPDEVNTWDSQTFSGNLRHNPENPEYNPHFRQLLHVGYKIAAEFGDVFTHLVRANEKTIAPLVTENILDNHIKPLFLD